MTHSLTVTSLRKSLDLTRVQLADLAGVDVSTVWRWEANGIPTKGSARAFLERLAKDADEGQAA